MEGIGAAAAAGLWRDGVVMGAGGPLMEQQQQQRHQQQHQEGPPENETATSAVRPLVGRIHGGHRRAPSSSSSSSRLDPSIPGELMADELNGNPNSALQSHGFEFAGGVPRGGGAAATMVTGGFPGGGGGISTEELLDMQRVLTGGGGVGGGAAAAAAAISGPPLRPGEQQQLYHQDHHHQRYRQEQLELHRLRQQPEQQQEQEQPGQRDPPRLYQRHHNRHHHYHQHHHRRSRDRDFGGIVKQAHRPPQPQPPPQRSRCSSPATVAAAPAASAAASPVVASVSTPLNTATGNTSGIRRAASSPPTSSSPPPSATRRLADGSASSASTATTSTGRSSRSGSGASTSTNSDGTGMATTMTTTTTPDSGNVLSLWGPDPVPLPLRFARIKRALIAGHEAAIEASWARLLVALRHEVEHIECLGAHLVPSVEFADLADPAQTARFGRDLRRYGVGVVRKVLPRDVADDAVRDTVHYLEARRPRPRQQQQQQRDKDKEAPATNAPAPGPTPAASSSAHSSFRAPRQDPTCFDCFWTPAQVRARAHPNVRRAQRFMMGLWEPDARERIAPHLPITYADRIRVHGGGFGFDSDAGGAGTPPAAPSDPVTAGLDAQLQQQSQFLAPQSADDWINALQSSAGIIAQVDNGSLERWEPDGYGRGGAYDHVFAGRWEDHDPWGGAAQRANSTTDLYNGYGACTVFRMFQGLLALSTIEPGTLRLMPSPRLATAYYLLRPFFAPRTPPPELRHGPGWEAYLAPGNWELQREPDTTIHGAVPGHAQRVTERWHPHLCLRSSLVTLPTLQPGDYIFWHPDLPYHISSNGSGSRPGGTGGAVATAPAASASAGPAGGGAGSVADGTADDVRMLVYIPAAPLTQTGALYLARQRRAFQRGHPGPDFDSSGRSVVAEDYEQRSLEDEMERVGGKEALRGMGLLPWEREESEDGEEEEGDGLTRLANLILFPE
ncbi:hypothetical protein JDV02_004272 [Purpureocillium takamizusanense]|uniref:Uncharacterized protein n=1 Tax=Purpureocillium takamizusanense TaxID=2060973 RepID=A0A9Q8QFI2_9HYPO|nr:uncharacterized protein JDV02_004272 [Purpureocillium takamizusanense]UNI17969.1 hypothetical protein JDV02_004272 [Purpureocillium takamizusanense]